MLIRFKSLETEYKNDYVIVSDPKTQTLITVLSGINRNEMVFTSSSNEMEIKFISDNDRESIGFEATYEQVCKYQHYFKGQAVQIILHCGCRYFASIPIWNNFQNSYWLNFKLDGKFIDSVFIVV